MWQQGEIESFAHFTQHVNEVRQFCEAQGPGGVQAIRELTIADFLAAKVEEVALTQLHSLTAEFKIKEAVRGSTILSLESNLAQARKEHREEADRLAAACQAGQAEKAQLETEKHLLATQISQLKDESEQRFHAMQQRSSQDCQ